MTADPLEIRLPHSTTPALVMSLVLHLLLLATVGWLASRPPHGTGSEADRPIGIAIVHRLPDRDRYVDAAEVTPADSPTEQSPEQSDSQAESAAAAAPPADLSPPIDLQGILQAMESTPAPVAGTGLAGETQLDGDALGAGRGKSSAADGAEATTMVFGVSGSGSQFVYVFDRSESMNGNSGRPLRAAKSELIRSLRTLTERQRFQIIFYNDKPKPFLIGGMPLQLIQGEPSNVLQAERYIDTVAAFGATEHESALKLALRMSPDVIFFLTDARVPRLSNSQLGEIRRRAERSGTTIHTIEFGSDAVEPTTSFLRDLAQQNNGQYQYVNVHRLRPAERQPGNDDPQQPVKQATP